MDEWTVYRIDEEPLQRLAALAPRCSPSGQDGRIPPG
jgi:hypothetical protein